MIMISIITPTYNESKNLEELATKINKALSGIKYELIVSDDNSPDGTAEVAKRLSKKYPIKILVRYKDKGLSPAVVDAFKLARGDIIGVIDADLSHPPRLIPEIVDKMRDEEADIAVGSRLVKGGGTEKWPASRKITSYIATLLARPLTKVKDPMSGFFFFRKDVIKDVKLKPRGYKILLEILAKGKAKKVIEIPFIFKDRTAGESKLTMKTNIEYLTQLLDLYLYKIRRFLK